MYTLYNSSTSSSGRPSRSSSQSSLVNDPTASSRLHQYAPQSESPSVPRTTETYEYIRALSMVPEGSEQLIMPRPPPSVVVSPLRQTPMRPATTSPPPKGPLNAFYMHQRSQSLQSMPNPSQHLHLPATLATDSKNSKSVSTHPTLTLTNSNGIQQHGFVEDPNRPVSQRPFSENYPWPYDPSSYYNMARSPTVTTTPKPMNYPVGWEEGGGLSRPVSMGGVDLPIPLSPLPPPVPEIPNQYTNSSNGGSGHSGNTSGVPNHHRSNQEGSSQVAHFHQRTFSSPPPSATAEYIPKASSLGSLTELYEICTHGQQVNPRRRTIPANLAYAIPEGVYVLNMYKVSTPPLQSNNPFQQQAPAPEHFTFGSSPTTPFYSIQALPDSITPSLFTTYDPQNTQALANIYNDLLVIRQSPTTNEETNVLTMGLNPHARKFHRHPQRANGVLPGDELITLIYPKQAAITAIEGCCSIIGDAQTIARKAVERAAETECCRLSWEGNRDRYYLFHPGVGKGGEVYLVLIDDGTASQARPASETTNVGFDVPGNQGSIKLINVDTSEALVVLDFSSNLLFINTTATNKIPNKYIVDVAVSTVLAVSVVEGRRIRDAIALRDSKAGAAGTAIPKSISSNNNNKQTASRPPLTAAKTSSSFKPPSFTTNKTTTIGYSYNPSSKLSPLPPSLSKIPPSSSPSSSSLRPYNTYHSHHHAPFPTSPEKSLNKPNQTNIASLFVHQFMHLIASLLTLIWSFTASIINIFTRRNHNHHHDHYQYHNSSARKSMLITSPDVEMNRGRWAGRAGMSGATAR